MMRAGIIAGLLGASLLATPVWAVAKLPSISGAVPAVLRGDQVDAFATALQEAGYRARIVANDDGSRYIESAASGVFFTVNFVDCKPGTGCGGMRFIAWWDKPDYVGPATLNEWNGGYRLARAAIDQDGDLVLDYYISLVGGVTRDNFLDSFDWWTMLVGNFKTFLDKKETAAVRDAKPKDAKGVAAVDEDVAG
jgi:hypothetical protein